MQSSNEKPVGQHTYSTPYNWQMTPFYRFLVEESVERIRPVIQGRRVLEVGCGDGVVTDLMSQHAAYVHGFDVNPRAVAFARMIVERPNVSFEVREAREVSIVGEALGNVDVVAAVEVFEHLTEVERDQFLEGARSALAKRQGKLVLVTPNAGRPAKRFSTYSRNPYHAHEYTPKELHTVLSAAGFSDITVTGLYLQPPWERLEHFANVIPLRAVFRALGRAGEKRPGWCRTLICVAHA